MISFDIQGGSKGARQLDCLPFAKHIRAGLRGIAMILAAILLLLAAGTDKSAAMDSFADAETVAAQAAADVQKEVDALQHEEDLAKARLELCQRSTRGSAEEYPQKVKQAVELNHELGSFDSVMEICQAYLTGKVDQLKLENARLEDMADE